MINRRVTKQNTAAARTQSLARGRAVVILAVPPVEELDLIGPLAVFAGVNRVLSENGLAYNVSVVSSEPRRVISGESGISLVTHGHYRKITKPIDTLIVVGSITSRGAQDPQLFAWLRERAERVRRVASICVAAYFLAEAGLLSGKRAATHWMFAGEMQKKYPAVNVDASPIWVQDGNLYTSAGVTAGIDLALAMVEEDQGAAVALQVARGLVVFLRRPGGQAQFSVALSAQTSERKAFRELQAWIAENLPNDLSVPALAGRAAMSPRNFSRVFTRDVGTTPAKFVERISREAAKNQMEESDRSLEEIAGSCGFGSVETMRRTFLARLQLTPGAYRNQFRTKVRVNHRPSHVSPGPR